MIIWNIWMVFCKKLCKKWIFFQNDSVENSLICPRTKSASHCLTELFPIYQNKQWTIRRRDNHIVVQSSHRNISKIDWFLERVSASRDNSIFWYPSYIYKWDLICIRIRILKRLKNTWKGLKCKKCSSNENSTKCIGKQKCEWHH